MRRSSLPRLSKREREIMDVVYRLGRATAADVVGLLPNPPTYTTVRSLLRILENKGHLYHETEGTKFVYFPTTPRAEAGASLLSHVVRTFFDGSAAQAMAALLGSGPKPGQTELRRMARLVEQARMKGTHSPP